MLKLFFSSIKMLYRDRQSLFWAMAFPVVFAVVFGLFDFNDAPELRFNVVARQPSAVSEALVEELGKVESFTVKQTSDFEAARRGLSEGEADLVVLVPELHQRAERDSSPTRLEVLYNGANAQESKVGLDAIGRVVQEMNLRLAGITSPPIATHARPVEAKTVDYYDFILPGLVAMGVMNFSIIGMAVAVTRYREQRILKRILATPLAPSRFLSAQVGARLLLSLVQTAAILAVGVFLFDGDIHGNVLWLFILVAVANLIFLNIGLAVGGRAANSDAAQGTANAVALPMMFLSGVFFPTDTLPEIVQDIVKYLPLTPLIEGMRAVSIDGDSIAQTAPQLGSLAAWVAVSFVIARRLFRFSEAR